MHTASRKILFIKLTIVSIAAVLAVFGFHQYSAKYERVSASAFNPTPGRTGAPGETTCASCHSNNPLNSGSGNVSITGLPANYLPNQQVSVTVTTSKEDAVVYGFQLTAIDSQGKPVGTYTLPAQAPAQMQTATAIVGGNTRNYVEHTVDGITPTMFGSKSWTFTWTAPAERAGKVGFYASGNAANSDGGPGGDYIYTTSKSTLSGTATSNFDADGKSDVAVFRPSNGVWYSLNSTNGSLSSVAFGASGDVIVPGDYDGDGRNDYAVFRPSNGVWYIQRSSTGAFTSTQFGASSDVPVVGDYDGDLKSDIAVWRPSNGVWYIQRSSNGAVTSTQFGVSGDKVAQGDFDGDAKTDIAVFRPAAGAWYIQKSRDGFTGIAFGASEDKPVQGDYDGDGKTDVAVFRPSVGAWYLLQSRAGFTGISFGISTDKPVPADYDGDGKIDIAVTRGSNWYILQSTDGFKSVLFGDSNDVPIPSGYIAQ